MEITVITIEGKDAMLKVCAEREEGSLNNKALVTLAACSAALRLGMRIEYCSDTPDAQKRVCPHSRGWSTWRLPLRF